MVNPEIININTNNAEEIRINTNSLAGSANNSGPNTPIPNRSANLGPGIELLMNESKRGTSSSADKDANLGNLRELEFELNI